MSEASYRGEHARRQLMCNPNCPWGGSLPGLPAWSDPSSFDRIPAPIDQ